MATITESSGEIEITSLSEASIGDRVKLVFMPIDAPNPPYHLKIMSPSGRAIVDNVLRDLPTGAAQSAPPFEFLPTASGVYDIEIRETKGRAAGRAKLQIR